MDRLAAATMDLGDPLAPYRDRFTLKGPIYLDGNSLGCPSTSVAERLAAAVRDWTENLVGGWSRWIDLPATVGDRVGRLIGAGPGQVVVCDSTSVNLYKLAAAALAAQPERRVILADADDFPTDRYVLQGLAKSTGAELRLLHGSAVDGLASESVGSAVDTDTALVCLSHVNFRSGARLDLVAVTQAAHRRGALVLWDLCHSAGAIPVGLDEAGADLAVGCTYKYLNGGPGSPAFAYVRRELQERLRQPIWGWFGQQDQFAMGPSYDPTTGMGRFLAGTPPVLGLLAVDAAVEMVESAGIVALWAKSQQFTAMLVDLVHDKLEPLGASLASPADPDRRGAHVSVAHRQAWPWCKALIDRRLVIGDFRPPDVIRLGPAPLYTRFVDVFDAVERMAEVLEAGVDDVRDRPRVT
ncbi:MAG: kynureninase [Acidimicrobiales bacterium]|jgi:kynureninase